jgi:hypothetical protein
MALKVSTRVPGAARRVERVVEAQGFDARTLTSARAVRLFRATPGKRSTKFEQILVILFRPLSLEYLGARWAGWRLVGEQEFPISPDEEITVIWQGELPASAASRFACKPIGSIDPEDAAPRRWPGPFTVARQDSSAGVGEYLPVTVWSFRVVWEGQDASLREAIALFNGDPNNGIPGSALYPQQVADGRVLRIDLISPGRDGVYERQEVWVLSERSSMSVDEYVEVNGLGPLGVELEDPDDVASWPLGAVFRVNLLDPATGVPREGIHAELERIEAELMALDVSDGLEWEPDGEEDNGWYEWRLGTNSRAVVRRFARELFAGQNHPLEHTLTFHSA